MRQLTPNAFGGRGALRQEVSDEREACWRRDIEAIRRDHASDIWMFDVPPPFERNGRILRPQLGRVFLGLAGGIRRRLRRGADALRHDRQGQGRLDFGLTIGLGKIGDRRTIVHERHSVPADD
jgi:hypothetical protein